MKVPKFRVKAGQFLTRLGPILEGGIPGRCSRWGCLLPIGPDSPHGSGPVCFICRENLRPTALTEEENETWKRHLKRGR